MDGVETSQNAGPEKPSVVEQFVVQSHEVDSIEEFPGPRQRPSTLRAHRSHHFGTSKTA